MFASFVTNMIATYQLPQLVMLCFIVAIRCSALPTWNNLEANTTSHVYNTWVNYTCGEGYLLADENGSQVTYCNSDGVWIPQLILCKGNSI